MEVGAKGSLPEICVVIVTYNFAKYLRECIDSILAQTLSPCEIIIYDDCSTDDSWNIITEYSQKYPDLFVVHSQKKNVGMHANGNMALRRAKGDLVSWLDGDDRWSPRKLELEWAAICQNPEVKMAYSNVHITDAAGQRTAIWYDGKGPVPPSGDVFIQVLSKQFFPGIRSIFRNPLVYCSALEEVGYHDEDVELYIDWDLKVRLTAAYPIAYSGEALVDYRIHSGGIHNQPQDTHLRDLITIYQKSLTELAKRTAKEISFVESELDSLARAYGAASLSEVVDRVSAIPEQTVLSSTVSESRHPEDGKDRRLQSDADTAVVSRDSERGENLIFLVSLPRSGSTLLQRVLANHPDVHTTAEPWVMLHPFYALKRQGFEAEYESDLARRALDEFLDAVPGGEETYIESLRAMASVLYGRALQQTGKRLFLDKTPRYFYILPELVRVFPKAKFVFLLRNPAAVLSSVLRTWLGNDLHALQKDQHYVDLIKGAELLSQGIRLLGDHAVTIHYEDLVSNPADTVKRVCNYVSIPFQPAMLEYGRAPVPSGTFGDPGSVHKHNTVVSDYMEIWRSHLANEQFRDFAINYIDALGESVFETLGYSSDATKRVICGEQIVDANTRVDRSLNQATGIIPRQREEAISLNKEGELAFNDGNINRAEACFTEAYRIDSEEIEVLNNLVVLYWQKSDVEKSLDYLVEGLLLDKSNRNLIVNGGQILAGINQLDEAKLLYSGYLVTCPDDKEVIDLLSAVSSDKQFLESNEEESAFGQGDTGKQNSFKCVSPESSTEGVGELNVNFVDYLEPNTEKSVPGISIVIPSYNQGRYLEETILSVLEQNYPNLELIVMDGGSTDQSVEIIKKYEDKITYWESAEDKGQYWAVDQGFRQSTGEIMAWINSDDKFHPGSFNTIASIFTQLSEVDWVTGTPNIMNAEGEINWCCSPIPVYSREYYLEKKYDFPRYIQQEGTFWRRSLWEKAGARLKTSLEMAGDLELWMRFFRYSRLHTTNVLLGCFRQYSDQKTANGLDLYHSEAMKELDKEFKKFLKRGEKKPEKAPIIVVHEVSSDGQDKTEENNMPEYLVTAIVSTYNSEKFIRGCLEDLEMQSIASRLEIIVVDSGSQQNEAAIVKDFQQRYSNIRYIRTEARETIYSAWNRAIAEARGKYLTNANTDDRHLPEAYERMVSELEANPDVALVYADSAVTDIENTGFAESSVQAHFRWPDFDSRHLFSVCYIGPQPMWRRSMHEKYGYFDAEMKVAGDYDFWLRMATKETFRHVAEVLGLYLASANSIEHAFAGAGISESETAKLRNWPSEWGKRPEPCGGYLVPVEQDSTLSGVVQGKEKPYISIIMPTKNRLHLLGRAVDSIIAQSFRNWELIIANDGGERIQAIIDSRNASGRIRCIEFNWSRGQAAARNTALTEARGEIICYLDDDDNYLPDHLQVVVDAMADDGNCFIYTDAVVVQEEFTEGVAREVGRSNPYAHAEYSHERLLVSNHIPINTWAHRRSCLAEAGLFDSTLLCYEDWEFLLRLAEKYEFHHIEKTTVEVRQRVDQIDNVSRQRLGDTRQAYQDIYARHDKLVTEDLRARREVVCEQLTRDIESWTAEGDVTVSASGTARDTPKDSYTSWRDQHNLNSSDIAYYSKCMMTEWMMHPSVHLVMTHVAGQEEAVADTLDSLGAQLYGGWGLSVVSNSSCPDPLFEETEMLEWCQVEGDLMEGANAIVEASSADWLGLLEPGSIFEPHMLYRHIECLHRHSEWRLVYMDEDRVDEKGEHFDPLFKPDCNLELLRALPYIGTFILVEREALLAAGCYGLLTGAETYDVVFSVIEQLGEQVVGHIPDVLIHRQDHFQLALDQDLIAENRRSSITAHLKRCGIEGEAKPGMLFGSCFADYVCNEKPPVEIIVPVNGKPETLELFLESLFSQTQYPDFRVRLLAMDNAEIPASAYARDKVDVVSYTQSETQWQEVLELANNSDTEYLVLMSPGAIAIQPDWLERLVVHFQKADVAVVAPRLVSADRKVVSSGIITGAGPYSVGVGAFDGLSLEDSGYMGRAQVAQEFTVVPTRCILVRKSVLGAVEELSTSLKLEFYQAVDFCMRIRETGGKIIWTPHSTLMFISEDQTGPGDASDLKKLIVRESETLCKNSLAELASDPVYNPNLRLNGKQFSVDDSFTLPLSSCDHSLSRIISFGVGSYGSWQYRVVQPLDALQKNSVAQRIHVPFSRHNKVPLPTLAELERIQPDTLLMHNTLHDNFIDALGQYKQLNNAFIVFGQDDLMTALPPKNPFSRTAYKDMKKRLRKCLSFADRLVVTTESLAEALRGLADDVWVVPNYLDASVWGELRSQRGVGIKPRVGWAGAQQHQGDLELLETVVRETADEVDWVFFGMCPQVLRPYVREVHNAVNFEDYPRKLATLNLDLAVAPLEHNRFNEAKSNLRILEYGILGWPVIASDIEPYRDMPVCQVINKPAAWIKAIREHVNDLDETRRTGDTLHEWVKSNWLLEQHLSEWQASLNPSAQVMCEETHSRVTAR